MKRILKIAAFLSVRFLVLVGVAHLATMEPVNAADGFIEHVREEDYSYAYQMLCPVLRKKMNEEQFVRTDKNVTGKTGAREKPSWGPRNISANYCRILPPPAGAYE